ncbi:IclR family transcriptional regulator [Salinisphaera sp. T31B1]
MKVLETLADFDEPASVSELAEACGLTRSNAHRVLATFQTLGYVAQDSRSRRYHMTLRVWSLGSKAVERLDFKQEARPFLDRLNEMTGETTHLSILDDIDVIYIDKLEARHAVRTFTRIGGRAPAICVATGKAALAFSRPERIDRAIAGIEKFTDSTVTDPSALRAELDAVREQTFAVNRGEWRGGAYGLAVPIFSALDEVVAAIGISAPRDRMAEDRIEALTDEIKTIGRQLSVRLGASARHGGPT